MANPSQRLQFICRSCRHSVLRPTSQIRAFSNSSLRPNIIPSFQQTSSPELDALFLDWRQRVFTPAALNSTHQGLVYKKSRHAILENDPGVTVTMTDGEDVKLEPMNAFSKPNKHNSLKKIAKILGSTNEADVWSQVPAFLEGMNLARERVPVWFLEKITRKANEQGQAGVIKQCAMIAKKTRVHLSMKMVTRELFLGSHERFVQARILGEDFEEENKFTESLALMLESKDHCGGPLKEASGQVDMRRDLTVMGVLLELAAARAIYVHEGKDLEGTTGSLAQKLLALARDNIVRREEKDRLEHAVEDWVPIANGIRLALQVNGLAIGKGKNVENELKNLLRSRLSELDAAIETESKTIKAQAEGKPRRALIMIENLKEISK